MEPELVTVAVSLAATPSLPPEMVPELVTVAVVPAKMPIKPPEIAPELVTLAVLLAEMPVAAQQTQGGAKPWTPPHTEWNDPDLQGVYTFATETPLQRPATLGDKASYTEAELQKLQEQLKEKHEENITTNEHFSYNALWFVGDQGRPTGRTSLIVDPENGRMPPLTARSITPLN